MEDKETSNLLILSLLFDFILDKLSINLIIFEIIASQRTQSLVQIFSFQKSLSSASKSHNDDFKHILI